MNVLVDQSLFLTPFSPYAGHSRIWLRLFQKLPHDIDIFMPAKIRKFPEPLAAKIKGAVLPVIRPYRIGAKVLDWTCHAINKTVPLDVLVPSHHVPQAATMSLSKRLPMVPILDDLTPELVPGTMSQWLTPKRNCLEAAALIICISESTKCLAMDFYNLPASRFRVAPLACDLVRPPLSDREVPPHPRPYFLVVGNRQGYKNFNLTLRSFGRIASSISEVDLVLIGPPLASFESEEIAALKLENRVISIGRLEDQALARFYAGALALVYPSKSEGFGIPPLEAMTCGTVPIVPNITSCPEVVGNAGLLIDPSSEEDLIAAMMCMVENESLRQEKIRLGQLQASLFSWDKTTDLIFSAWREVAQG